MRRVSAENDLGTADTEPTVFRRFARVLPAAILALAAVTVLAGCQPADNGTDPHVPDSSPSAPAEPTPSATPVSLIGTDCAGLLPLAAVQSALASDVEPAASTPNTTAPWTPLIEATIAQHGGIKCVWQNGDLSTVSEYRGLTLWLLPNADAAWAAQAAELRATDDQVDLLGGDPIEYGDESITDCGGDVDPWYYGTCFYNVRVGSYWLSIEIDGMLQDTPEHAGRPVLEAASAAVAALPDAAAAWTPPPGTAQLASSCDEAVPLATARSAMAIDTLLAPSNNNATYPVETAALADVGGLSCVWQSAADWVDPAGETFGVQVSLIAIPGGAWAWSGTSAPPYDTGYALAPVTGIGDAAWGGCRTDYDACQLQVLSDGTWFSVDAGYTHGALTPLITIGSALIASSR